MLKKLTNLFHSTSLNNTTQFTNYKGENNMFFQYLCADIYEAPNILNDEIDLGKIVPKINMIPQEVPMKMCQVNIRSKLGSGLFIILRPLDCDLVTELKHFLKSLQENKKPIYELLPNLTDDMENNQQNFKLRGTTSTIPSDVTLESILHHMIKSPPNEYTVTYSHLDITHLTTKKPSNPYNLTIIKNASDDMKDVLDLYHQTLQRSNLENLNNVYEVDLILSVDPDDVARGKEEDLPCYSCGGDDDDNLLPSYEMIC